MESKITFGKSNPNSKTYVIKPELVGGVIRNVGVKINKWNNPIRIKIWTDYANYYYKWQRLSDIGDSHCVGKFTFEFSAN